MGMGFCESISNMFTTEIEEHIEKRYEKKFQQKFQEKTSSTFFEISDKGEKILEELQEDLKQNKQFFNILRKLVLSPENYDFTNQLE